MLFGKAIINVRTFNLFNFIYLFIHSFIHSFIYPSIHPSIHLLTYLLISTEIAPLLIDSTFARATVHCPETPSLGHLSLTATSRDAVITTANTTNEHTSSASFSVSLQLGDLLTSKWQHLERSQPGSVESTACHAGTWCLHYLIVSKAAWHMSSVKVKVQMYLNVQLQKKHIVWKKM